MGRVTVSRIVYKESKIPPLTIIKIRNEIETLLLHRDIRPRKNWQEVANQNGKDYHVFLRERDGLIFIRQIKPATSKRRIQIKRNDFKKI